MLPDGTFGPCFKFAFDRSRSIGDVRRGVDYEAVVKNMNFALSHPVWSYAPCRKCFARYKCGGPCFASAQAFNKDMGVFCGIECEMKREKIVREFYVVALLKKRDPVFFNKILENNSKTESRKSMRKLFDEHYLKN